MSDHLEHAGFQTRAIHAGQPPDPTTGAINVPVYLTSTFVQDTVGVHLGYEYSRTGNPTRAALERCLASLEGATYGLAFASGMAAEDAVLRLLSPGDHVIIPTDAYGGTWRLVAQVHASAGLTFSAVDLADPHALDGSWRETTRLLWVETPTNPLLSIVDIATVAALAHERGALCVVDNTFATPYLQQPLTLGWAAGEPPGELGESSAEPTGGSAGEAADLVVHSTTKYLGGHSDVVGGFVATNDEDLATRLAFLQNATGAIPGPLDCYLVLRGIKTLGVRMERHCRTAAEVAGLLRTHPAVDLVFYPGLADHPGHEVAARQMSAFGGMVSFTLTEGEPAALEVVTRTRLFALAESLGGVESLIEHPARMTHAAVAGSTNEVDPALVRLSVGLETPVDLLADLAQALDAVA